MIERFLNTFMNEKLNGIKQVDHFGVYGVIFNSKGNHVLLIEKSKGPYKGMLDLPGGRPEFNELPEETLYREILEETGLYVQKSKQVEYLVNIFKYDKTQFRRTALIYLVQAVGNIRTRPDG